MPRSPSATPAATLPLTTGRLVLDRLGRADTAAFFRYRCLPEVRAFQSFAPEHLADAEAFVARLPTAPFGSVDGWFQLAVRLRRTGALVGDLGVRVQTGPGAQAEVGFTIAPDHQRQGLATEAVTALLDHLVAHHGVHRVHASVDPRNTGSVRLLERLGLRREAHHIESVWSRGAWTDDLVYAVLAREWVARTPGRRASGEGRAGGG